MILLTFAFIVAGGFVSSNEDTARGLSIAAIVVIVLPLATYIEWRARRAEDRDHDS